MEKEPKPSWLTRLEDAEVGEVMYFYGHAAFVVRDYCRDNAGPMKFIVYRGLHPIRGTVNLVVWKVF